MSSFSRKNVYGGEIARYQRRVLWNGIPDMIIMVNNQFIGGAINAKDPAHGYTGSRHDVTYHEAYVCLSKEALRRLESTELPGRMQTHPKYAVRDMGVQGEGTENAKS
jgi:hypothetical protein